MSTVGASISPLTSEELLQKFQQSWALALEPDWRDYLLPEDDSAHRQHVLALCRLDLNWRIELQAASSISQTLESLTFTLYWPSVQHLFSTHELESLCMLEFELRWRCGLSTTRDDFLRCIDFDIHPSKLACHWPCPNLECQYDENDVQDQAEIQTCSACGSAWATSELFPQVNPWCLSNAPNWLLRQLADGPVAIGVPGTYGAAFVVYDEDAHHQPTVVKILHSRWTSNADVVSRFSRESRILALLDGEGTPFLRRSGRLPNGRYYFQMQCVEGDSLSMYVNSNSIHALIQRFEEAVDAVAAAHSLGILHRDISPRNVVIDGKRDRAVVVDWGQGAIENERRRLADQSPQDFNGDSDFEGTSLNSGFGCAGFQAPELQQDATLSTPASDVFSLGSLLVYCLSCGGAVAGNGIDVSNSQVKLQGIESAKEFLLRLRASGPLTTEVELLDLCDECIQLCPEHRPKSAVEVARQLRHWRSQRQKRLEVIPVVRARNRLAWSLLTVVAIASVALVGLALALKWKAEDALNAELSLSTTRELARIQAERSAEIQEKLAYEKTKEAETAQSFSSLLIDVFKSSDPLALEGTGYRDSSSSVRDLTAIEVLTRLSQVIDQSTLKTLEARAKALDVVGNALRGLGEISRAEELLREAERIQNQPSYSGTPLDYVSLKFHLAILHHDMREFKIAEEYYMAALAMVQSHEPQNELVSQIQFRYAWLLAEALRRREALELFHKVKKNRQQSEDTNSQALLVVDLAILLASLDNMAERDVTGLLETLGDSDSIIIKLATEYIPIYFLRKSNKDTLAARQYEELLVHAEGALPSHHPVLGMILGDMAALYRKTGNTRRAIVLAEQALNIARNTIPTHPLALQLYRDLGREYEDAQRYDDAISLYQQALGYLSSRDSPELMDARSRFHEASLRVESMRESSRSTATTSSQ